MEELSSQKGKWNELKNLTNLSLKWSMGYHLFYCLDLLKLLCWLLIFSSVFSNLIISTRKLSCELMSQNGQVSPHYCMAADCDPVSSTLRYLWKIESSSPSCVMKKIIERGCSAAAACCILSCWDCLVFKVWLILILLVWSHETIFVDSALLFVKPLAAQVLSCFFIGYQLYVLCPWETLELEILRRPVRRWFFHQKLPGTSRTVERRSWAMQAIAFPSTFTGADGLERWETCWEILLVWLVLQYSLKLHASGTFCRWDSIVIKIFDTSFQNRGDFSLKKDGSVHYKAVSLVCHLQGSGEMMPKIWLRSIGVTLVPALGWRFWVFGAPGGWAEAKNGESLTSFQVVGSQIPYIPWKMSGIFSHAVPKSKFIKTWIKNQWIFPSTPTKSFTKHHPTQNRYWHI